MFSFSPFLLLLPLLFSSAQSTQCYCLVNNAVTLCSALTSNCGPATAQTDGGAQLCCQIGHTCGQDNVCHFIKNVPNTSGFYFGGCTDPFMRDPACSRHCETASSGDIVYSQSTSLWSCCGQPDHTTNCSAPRLDNTFQLFAPLRFSAVATAIVGGAKSVTSLPTAIPSPTKKDTTTSSDAASSSTDTGSATHAPTPTPTDDGNVNGNGNGTKLTFGAKLGIGVGAGILVVGLAIGAGVWVLLRRRAAPRDVAGGRKPDGFAELKDLGFGEGGGPVPHWAPDTPHSTHRTPIGDGGLELARLQRQESRSGSGNAYAAELDRQESRAGSENAHAAQLQRQESRAGSENAHAAQLQRQESRVGGERVHIAELPG